MESEVGNEENHIEEINVTMVDDKKKLKDDILHI